MQDARRCEKKNLLRIYDKRVYLTSTLNHEGKLTRNCLIDLSNENDKNLNFKENKAIIISTFIDSFLSKYVDDEPESKYWFSNPVYEYATINLYRNGLNDYQIKSIHEL